MEFEYFPKIFGKIQVLLKPEKTTGSVHEDLCTFVVVSRLILLRIRSVSDKCCREIQNTRFQHFFSDSRAVYEIKWKNMVEPGGPPDENIIQCVRLVCCIAKATNTHTNTHTLRLYIYPIAFTR
jgi:hypothetical protein